MAHHYLPIVYAMTITTCPNPREVVGYLPAVKPTWFFAVPRIWEKLKAGMEGFLASGEGGEQKRRLLDAAMRKVELEQAGEPVPEDLAATVAQADEQLFAQIRAMLGFDQIAAVNVGAAPTPREVLVFFHAIGVPLAELWGMSETCGAGACNPPEKIKIGTVGPPTPGVEARLAEDGELLIRSDVVMTGYRNLPDKTSEALDADGWLHTGDIATIDEDGYITIVDRKKELIISAAGKNMSPANIESELKGASPLIGQACTIGDGRSYNTALIVLDADFAPAWAGQNGLEGKSLEELAGEDAIRAAVQAGVDKANDKLSRVEQIKKFTIVEGDWAPGGDELTPTMKLKRKPIAEKYASAIEAMYGDASDRRGVRAGRPRRDGRLPGVQRVPSRHDGSPVPRARGRTDHQHAAARAGAARAGAGPMEWASAMGNQAVARLARQAMEPSSRRRRRKPRPRPRRRRRAEVEQLEAEGIGMDALAAPRRGRRHGRGRPARLAAGVVETTRESELEQVQQAAPLRPPPSLPRRRRSRPSRSTPPA